MRKIAALLSALFLVFALCGCGKSDGSANTETVASSANTETVGTSSNTETVDLKEIEKQIELSYIKMHTQEYLNSDPEHFALIQVKNNSDYCVDLTVNVIFYNNGTIVDAKNAYFDSFTVNEWYATVVRTTAEFTDIKMEITNIQRNSFLIELDDYQFSDIVSMSDSLSGNKVLISSKNTLNRQIYGSGYVLFFMGDDVVDYSLFVFNLDGEKEIMNSCETRKDFSSYQLFIDHIRLR